MANPPVPDDQLRRQFENLLALPDTDPQAALLKDLLGSVLRLNESRLDMLDLKISHRTLREMRYAFRAFRPYRERRKVSIFGSARIPQDNPLCDLARRFARLLAERGYMVITGAGEGIMRASNEGAGRENGNTPSNSSALAFAAATRSAAAKSRSTRKSNKRSGSRSASFVKRTR